MAWSSCKLYIITLVLITATRAHRTSHASAHTLRNGTNSTVTPHVSSSSSRINLSPTPSSETDASSTGNVSSNGLIDASTPSTTWADTSDSLTRQSISSTVPIANIGTSTSIPNASASAVTHTPTSTWDVQQSNTSFPSSGNITISTPTSATSTPSINPTLGSIVPSSKPSNSILNASNSEPNSSVLSNGLPSASISLTSSFNDSVLSNASPSATGNDTKPTSTQSLLTTAPSFPSSFSSQKCHHHKKLSFTAACSCQTAFEEYQATYTGSAPALDSWNIPADCCHCYPQVNRVKVLFWPVKTAAPNPNITEKSGHYELISRGFTYTSPYVYVVYRGLKTAKECAAGTVWHEHESQSKYHVTRSYLPDQLSTRHCKTNKHHYTAINYTQLEHDPTSDCIGRVKHRMTLPWLSVPTDILQVNPLWSTCTYGGDINAYDPPHALQKASVLVASQDSDTDAMQATPAPGARVSPEAAVATTTAAPVVGSASQSGTGADDSSNGSDNDNGGSDGITNKDTSENGSGDSSGGSNGNSNGNAAVNPNSNPSQTNSNDNKGNDDSSNAPVNRLTNPDDSLSNPGPVAAAGGSPENQAATSRLLIADQTVSRDANGNLIVGSRTIPPGATATIGTDVIANQASGVVNVDGTRYSMGTTAGATLNAVESPNPVLIDGERISRDAKGDLVVGTVTIPPGAIATIGTDVIANQASGLVNVDGTQYSMATTAGAILNAVAPSSPTAIDGERISRDAAGDLVVGTITIPPGATATVGGDVIANPISGSVINVDGTAYTLAPTSGTVTAAVPTASASLIMVDGELFTALPDGDVAVSGHTLTPGASAVTMQDGVVVSLGRDGYVHADGSSTMLIHASATSVGGMLAFESAVGSRPDVMKVTKKKSGAAGMGGCLGIAWLATSFSIYLAIA